MTIQTEPTDVHYQIARACEERARAAACPDRTTALIHLQLAAEYERRAGRLVADAPATHNAVDA